MFLFACAHVFWQNEFHRMMKPSVTRWVSVQCNNSGRQESLKEIVLFSASFHYHTRVYQLASNFLLFQHALWLLLMLLSVLNPTKWQRCNTACKWDTTDTVRRKKCSPKMILFRSFFLFLFLSLPYWVKKSAALFWGMLNEQGILDRCKIRKNVPTCIWDASFFSGTCCWYWVAEMGDWTSVQTVAAVQHRPTIQAGARV